MPFLHTLNIDLGHRAPVLIPVPSHCFLPSCFLMNSCAKKFDTLLDLCVSSLRRGHANLLCILPILTDDPRRESEIFLLRTRGNACWKMSRFVAKEPQNMPCSASSFSPCWATPSQAASLKIVRCSFLHDTVPRTMQFVTAPFHFCTFPAQPFTWHRFPIQILDPTRRERTYQRCTNYCFQVLHELLLV